MNSRLTLIKIINRRVKGTRGWKTHIKGLYLCECGNEVEIKQSYVNYGNRKTCGCGIGTVKTGHGTHNLRKHALYGIWSGMKDRCHNSKTPKYRYYGAKGVTVCDEWRKDFKVFYDWCIANGWQKGLEVDKDKKGKGLLYSPDTCTIITKAENNKYRNSTKFITRNGETKCLLDWCKTFNISDSVYRLRIKKGWDSEKALTTPIRKKK